MCYRTAIIYPDGEESVVAYLPNLKLVYKYHRHYEDYVIEQFKKVNPHFLYSVERVYVVHDDFGRKLVYASFVRDSSDGLCVAQIVTSRVDENPPD